MKSRGTLWNVVDLATRDVGRKIFALVFAVVLYEVLDKQVQADDSLSVTIQYVNESRLAEVTDNPAQPQVLLIAQRGTGGSKPLVVADVPPPAGMTLQLHASKDALDRVKLNRHRFIWRLGKEGSVAPTTEDFEGIDKLLAELGSGGRVELSTPMRFNVESEESLRLTLGPADLEFEDRPARGYSRDSNTVVFQPPEIQLVGPHSAIEEVQSRRAELFGKIRLDQRTSVSQALALNAIWEGRLRTLDLQGRPLATVQVAVEFQRKMVAPPEHENGRFEVQVTVIYNDDRLSELPDPKSNADGWHLEFTKPGARPRVALQLLVPESQSTIDAMELSLAKKEVEAVVRASEVTVNRQTVPVHIWRLKGFPSDLDVVFADGQEKVELEVSWKGPDAVPHGPEDKGKKSGE